MPKFRITLSRLGDPTEDVVADQVVDAGHEGQWVDFQKLRGSAGNKVTELVLRLRSKDVQRVQQVQDSTA
jgi:hypothetical protein